MSTFATSSKYLVSSEKGTVKLFGDAETLFAPCLYTRTSRKEILECEDNFGTFYMSLETLRFMRTIPYTNYVTGVGSGTPHMEIGTCTTF